MKPVRNSIEADKEPYHKSYHYSQIFQTRTPRYQQLEGENANTRDRSKV